MDSLSPDTDWQNLFAILKTTMEEKGQNNYPEKFRSALLKKMLSANIGKHTSIWMHY
ncbi:Uncharacterised protein [Rikenella microfusus]|uniref:Uncharacterized protein n=1 Tax=Rikenella microfusus TaxID=28139 RepID=A0A379MPZ4_9BACT|nr:Uncharacterised protein [Rikenella microfusus]